MTPAIRKETERRARSYWEFERGGGRGGGVDGDC